MYKPQIDYSKLYDKVQEGYALLPYCFGRGKSLTPIRYTLELTYRCNLNCSFCYVGKIKNTQELSTEEWLKIIDQIPPFRLITFIGGEVLLRKDFKILLEQSLKRNKVNLVTNGTLLNEDLIKTFVEKKLTLLSISIDGIGEKHDIIRGHQGTFDKVINNINKFNIIKGQKKFPLLDIKTVILENNLNDLVDIYKLAQYHNADFLTLAFLKGCDLQQNINLRENFTEEFFKTDYPIDPYFNLEHFEEVYKKLKDLSKNSKTKIRFYPKFDSKKELEQIKTFFSKGNEKKMPEVYNSCKYPWVNLNITPEGNIYPCLSYKIGNIKDKYLKDLWNNDKYIEFRNQLKENNVFTACQTCCQLSIKI